VSVVLFVVSGMMRSRGVGTKGRAGTGSAPGKTGSKAGGSALPARSGRSKAEPVDDDLADVEAILRKHGIT
jgi:hypothetical protein